MKALWSVILLSVVLSSSADIFPSRNFNLPFGPSVRIPSPVQSLLPPSLENSMKDYSLGLVPPAADNAAQIANSYQHVQTPIHQQRVINPAVQLRPMLQQRQGQFIDSSRTTQNHHFTNRLQPQVHPHKTVVFQPNTHHQQRQQQVLQSHGSSFIIPTSTQQYSYHSVPVIQSAVHQNSAHAHFGYVPVHRVPNKVRPSVQQSVGGSRLLSSSGVRIIQSYPSVSYEATKYGSTLTLNNPKLDAELVPIIQEVLNRHHF